MGILTGLYLGGILAFIQPLLWAGILLTILHLWGRVPHRKDKEGRK
jgi:hypothetical protein